MGIIYGASFADNCTGARLYTVPSLSGIICNSFTLGDGTPVSTLGNIGVGDVIKFFTCCCGASEGNGDCVTNFGLSSPIVR